MMNKVGKLTLNELIKQYKKMSTKIIILLILLFAAAQPFITKALSNSSHYWSFSETIEYNQDEVAGALNNIQGKSDAEIERSHDLLPEGSAPAYKFLLNEMNAMMKTAIGFKIDSYEDWRVESATKFLELKSEAIFCKALAEGYDIKSVDAASRYVSWYSQFLSQKYTDMPAEEISDLYNRMESETKDIADIIAKNDYQAYTKQQVDSLKDDLKEAEAELDSLESQAGKAPENSKLKQSVKDAQSRVNLLTESIDILNIRYEKKINYDQNWQNSTLNDCESAVHTAYQPPIAREDFGQSYELDMYGSYEKYLSAFENSASQAKETLLKNKYSLAHDIPQPKFEDSTRAAVTGSSTFIIIISVFMALVAGGIVSSEYGKGTIRLLLIRPVSRNKILLSKLFAVIFIGITTFLGCFILNTASQIVLHGFSDLTIPVLTINGGVVKETGFLFFMLTEILQGFSMLFFVTAVAFAASTVFKNSAIADVLGVVSSFLVLPVMIILSIFGSKLSFLAYTPIPYMNIPYLQGASNGMFESLNEILLFNMNLPAGALQVYALSLVLIILAFISFNHHDVKN